MATTEPIYLPTGLRVDGAVTPTVLNIPLQTIVDEDVNDDAGIQYFKLESLIVAEHVQAAGSDVAAADEIRHIVRGTSGAKIVDVVVVCETVPTGGDKAFTVDVKVGNSSTSYASVLSSVVTVNSSSTAKSPITATISSADLDQGDSIKIVVATSGSTGSQGQGLRVEVRVAEVDA